MKYKECCSKRIWDPGIASRLDRQIEEADSSHRSDHHPGQSLPMVPVISWAPQPRVSICDEPAYQKKRQRKSSICSFCFLCGDLCWVDSLKNAAWITAALLPATHLSCCPLQQQHRALLTNHWTPLSILQINTLIRPFFTHEVSTAGQLLFTLKQLMYYSSSRMLRRLLKVFFRQVYYHLWGEVWKDVQE